MDLLSIVKAIGDVCIEFMFEFFIIWLMCLCFIYLCFAENLQKKLIYFSFSISVNIIDYLFIMSTFISRNFVCTWFFDLRVSLWTMFGKSQHQSRIICFTVQVLNILSKTAISSKSLTGI